MNIIPCASQNTDAITLPADRCVFLRFGFGSSRSVHLADCRLYFMYFTKSKSPYFDEEVKAYRAWNAINIMRASMTEKCT
jgi:hypothetical protein